MSVTDQCAPSAIATSAKLDRVHSDKNNAEKRDNGANHNGSGSKSENAACHAQQKHKDIHNQLVDRYAFHLVAATV